jgi:hypothetical protein
MATIKKKTKTYTVTQIPLESTPQSAAPKSCAIETPHYDRDTDEPVFQQAWRSVGEKMARRAYRTGTTLPKDGIRLRGAHAKQPT